MIGYTKLILAMVILAVVVIVLLTPASQPIRAAGLWYVAPGGSDSSDCLSPAAACATINGALNKLGFVPGDTVRVAAGVYVGTGNEVALINKSATLVGGWDASFSMQNGVSTLDGQNTRRVITVNTGVISRVERFTVRYGYSTQGGGIYNGGNLELVSSWIMGSSAPGSGLEYIGSGGGIYNTGIMTITASLVSGNAATANLGGGGIYTVGKLLLINSYVQNNSSVARGGGIAVLGGTVDIENSVISDNTANHGGGLYVGEYAYVASYVSIYNSTITHNSTVFGGGIFVDYINIRLQNTIVAGNTDERNAYPDCYGGLVSQGYNVIGTTLGCGFASSTGDLYNVNPMLVDFGRDYVLAPNSPAIDAGEPSGCKDARGNLIATDLRGLARPQDGNADGSARCDSGAYEYDPNNPLKQVFLPIATRNFCANFFDDFSNPASGWPVGEDDFVRAEYLNGEYRILTKQGGYLYLFRSPPCSRENYVVETDARWVGTPGDSYGLLFGITQNFSQYYLFYVSTDFGDYGLFRRDPGGFSVLQPFTPSSAIRGGGAINHLKATRDGSQITLEVNGTLLGTWFDGTIGGSTWAGIYSSPYENIPVSDARFDNFSMASLLGSGLAVQGSNTVQTSQSTFIPVERNGLPTYVDRFPVRHDVQPSQE